MDNEKIVNKLDWVIGEVQKELKGEDENLLKDLNSLLEKVIKNCEVSKKYKVIGFQKITLKFPYLYKVF